MLESITRQGQYNHYSERSKQVAGSWQINGRSVFMCTAAIFLLAMSSHNSEAEDLQKRPAEIETSSQPATDGQTQATEKPDTVAKPRCRPKKPCPKTENSQ